jgi:hypothetical protein
MTGSELRELIEQNPDREIRVTSKNGVYYAKVCPVGGCNPCPDANNPDCP